MWSSAIGSVDRVLKRGFDVLVSSIALFCLWPILLFIGFLIRFEDGGAAFFRQERVGLGGRRFQIWKFRTMATDAEASGRSITVGRDPRITRVGRFLRATKLDEIPQLINVWQGDMSFVGPRPEVPRYVALYPPDVAQEILSVRPGITDPASLEFRNEARLLGETPEPERFYIETVMPKKLELALRYVRQRSFLGDLSLIFRTIWAVLPWR